MGEIKKDNLAYAITIAVIAHDEQKDEAGEPYILHPLHVMFKMKTTEEKIVGVLHDVVEDTDVTLEDLQKCGFSAKVLHALDCLNHREWEPYLEVYIESIKRCPLARKVKVEDLKHNMDLTRIKKPQAQDFARVEKYKKALEILQKEDEKSEV